MAEVENRTLRYAIATVTSENFGDHGAMMRREHVPVPGETVEALVQRVLLDQKWRQVDTQNWIEIRIMQDVDGKPAAPEPEGFPF